MESMSLDHVMDVIADVARMLYLCKQAKLTLLKKMGWWAICFSQYFAVQERFVEMCTVLQENCLQCSFC